MNKFFANQEYMRLIDDIYNNEQFLKIKKIEHHGVTRFEHSLKVSYYSYKIAKLLRLDYIDVARAGLLHDFFLSNEDRNKKERFVSVFKHPKICVLNSMINFDLTPKEIDIIRSHMFPINLKLPQYAESWVVSIVDKSVAISEFYHKLSNCFKFKYATNVYLLFLINFIR